MGKKIFIVTSVIYSSYDDDLWQNCKAFSNEKVAREYFKQEERELLSYMKGEDTAYNPDELYPVDVDKKDDKTTYFRDSDEDRVKSEVKIYRFEF